MSSLTEFLTKRIAEDATWLLGNGECLCDDTYCRPDCIGRMRSEWNAKRRLVAHWSQHAPRGATLKALAAVYADHPDYREEWRP